MEISINTAFGLEGLAQKECERLGYGIPSAKNGRLRVSGDYYDIAKLNINLRTAERVMIIVGEFNASSFDELFESVKALRWKDYIDKEGKVNVSGKCVKSTLMSIRSCQSIVKKAIITNLMNAYGVNSLLESGAEYDVEFSVYMDTVTISLNTSGSGLHKRGYRDLSAKAPLKETLGAGLVMLSGYKGDGIFADCFCGSGTIPIEAGLIAKNIPANLKRDFAFMSWKCYPMNEYQRAKEEGYDKINNDKKVRIYGRDIDNSCVTMSRRHAKRAGLSDCIIFENADMRTFYSSDEGILVSNLPYGARLDIKDIRTLYSDLGKMYAKIGNFSAHMLTSFMDFERVFQRKAVKKRKLFNADLECYLYSFTKQQKEKRGNNE